MKVLPLGAASAEARGIGPPTSNVVPLPPPLFVERPVLYYHLKPSRDLPSFDSRRLVKSRLCSDSQCRWWQQFMRKHARLVTLGYFVGLFYRLYGLVAPAQYSGGYVVILALFLQLPAVLNTTISLCFDFLAHMAHSFEFWFFCGTNTLGTVSLAVAFQDARATLCFVTWLEIENARLIDAYCTASSCMSYIVGVAGLGAVYFGGIAVAVATRAIEIHAVLLWRTPRGLELHLDDVIVSAFVTVSLLMARIAFRKRNALRRSKGDVEVECVSYRCRLRFVQNQPSSRNVRSLTASIEEPWRVQLHEIVEPQVFVASDVILNGVWDPTTQRDVSLSLRRLWHALLTVSAVTLAGLCVSVVRNPLDPTPFSEETGQSLAFGTSIVHALTAAPILGLHQRQLLRLLLHSFDFIFLLTSGICTSAAFCYLCRWRLDLCAVHFCLCLWFFVAISSDALTPAAKQLLGFSARRRAGLLLFLLTAQVFLVLEVAVFGQLSISDRVVVDLPTPISEAKHRVTVSAVSVVLTRTITTISWMAQILWLSWFAESEYDDLILLQGSAEYAQARRPWPRDKAVVPIDESHM